MGCVAVSAEEPLVRGNNLSDSSDTHWIQTSQWIFGLLSKDHHPKTEGKISSVC